MKKIKIADRMGSLPIVVEEEAYGGVLRIALKSANDIELVTGSKPMIESKILNSQTNILLYATVGKSKLVEELVQQGKISLDKVIGFRETFGIFLIEQPWEGVEQALVVVGSDKRGTIYGIFHLSEQMGVSPLLYWGDATPVQKDEIEFDKSIEYISKEPSVRYRGFFINDEWPCFGNWTMEHFGGFTAKMYDHVFELLLRLKGNYLWPAMWTSSFALDGPDEEGAILADEYGVIMGNSHHEPCLRASEEWDIYKGEASSYGTKWNYTTNKEGLLAYWKDGLRRSSKYENIITVGMRGERDSAIEGTYTLEDNIEILKDIIKEQSHLIQQVSDTYERNHPKLLAIYKEVEQYFYGNKEVPGLRNWEGLKDIILMFCEDNFGNMRTLPDEKLRTHEGGLGMYYHLDYHGGPVSYEWINTTPLSKIWEQMTEAYEYGIQEVWMVNVGDVKGNEFPLSYFMSLAYDYEKWGITSINSTDMYTKEWIRTQFGSGVSNRQVEELADLLTESVALCHLRRPEALNSHIYHPAHYHEADRMIARIHSLCERAETLNEELKGESKKTYYSLIYHALQSGMNLLLMQLYAGKNEHYAKQGKMVANRYRDKMKHAIERDRQLAKAFGNAFDRKWKGMELELHIGFTKWNDDGCRYPLQMTVEPFERPRMIVSRADRTEIALKNYGSPDQIVIRDFMYPGCETVEIEVANDGTQSFLCQVIQEECQWIQVNWEQKEIEEQEILKITCRRDMLNDTEQIHRIHLTDGDATVEILIYGTNAKMTTFPEMTFFEQDGIIAIYAEHFAYQGTLPEGEWKVLENYGRVGSAIKAFPVTRSFTLDNSPYVAYQLAVEEEGDCILEVLSAPSNPLEQGGGLAFGVSINAHDILTVPSVSQDYVAGEPSNDEWGQGVLNQIHITKIPIQLQKGLNEIRIYAVDPGFVLEEIIVYKTAPRESYLGPEESYYRPKEGI